MNNSIMLELANRQSRLNDQDYFLSNESVRIRQLVTAVMNALRVQPLSARDAVER